MSDSQPQRQLSDREQLDALQQRLDQWKQKARQQLEDAAKKNESLRRQLDTVTADRDALRSKEEDRNVATDALVARAVALQEQLAASEARFREQSKQMQDMREGHGRQLHSLEGQVSQLQSENEKILEQKLKQQQAVAALEVEAAKARRAAIAATEKLRKLGYDDDDDDDDDDGSDADEQGEGEQEGSDQLDQLGDDSTTSPPSQKRPKKIKRNKKEIRSECASAATSMRIAMLEQQLEERSCSVAVVNALYSQAKAEARAATAAMATINDDHNRSVDQLRSAIATMTVQVAAKTSAADSLRQQLADSNKRAAWSESEVLRLRDDAAERERAFDELFQHDQQQQRKTKGGAGDDGEKASLSASRRAGSSSGDSGFDAVDYDDDDQLFAPSDSGNASASLMQKKIVDLEQQLLTATQALEQSNCLAQAKEARNRHLELRVEEQQGMVRHLAKQLSDATATAALNNSSSSPSKRKRRTAAAAAGPSAGVGIETGNSDSASDNEFDFAATSAAASSSSSRMWLEAAVYYIETTKLKLQRLFNTYKVLAPMVFGAMALVLFLIWFSRGSGPAVNRLDLAMKRSDQLESELGTVRAALQKLREKCP